MTDKLEYHIGLSKKASARYAILPGDPGRVAKIAEQLDQPLKIGQNREFLSYSGFLHGEKVLVTSTGIGGPSAAIALEELGHIGVDTVIRVGTCGGIQKSVASGDLVIVTAAVRMEGTSKEYMPVEYPAAADFSVTEALTKASNELLLPYHTGVVQSKDSFYGQHDPDSIPIGYDLKFKWEAWKHAGVLASEMECAAVFTVSAIRNIRAGAVLTALWNQETQDKKAALPGPENAISAAIKALSKLIEKDKACS